MDKSAEESYKHYYAKQVLQSWLLAAKGRFFSLRWSAKGQRIYQEYPLLLVNGQATHGLYDECFDEIPSKLCDCPVLYRNLLLSSALNPCEHRFSRSDNIPSRIELLELKCKLGAIVDLAICDGGRLKYIFELVHTNPCSPMKRKLLLNYAQRFDAVVYEVDADYVLRQVCSPERWRGVKLAAIETQNKKWRVRGRGRKRYK